MGATSTALDPQIGGLALARPRKRRPRVPGRRVERIRAHVAKSLGPSRAQVRPEVCVSLIRNWCVGWLVGHCDGVNGDLVAEGAEVAQGTGCALVGVVCRL